MALDSVWLRRWGGQEESEPSMAKFTIIKNLSRESVKSQSQGFKSKSSLFKDVKYGTPLGLRESLQRNIRDHQNYLVEYVP